MSKQLFIVEVESAPSTRQVSDHTQQLAVWIEHLVQSRMNHWTYGPIPKVVVRAVPENIVLKLEGVE